MPNSLFSISSWSQHEHNCSKLISALLRQQLPRRLTAKQAYKTANSKSTAPQSHQ